MCFQILRSQAWHSDRPERTSASRHRVIYGKSAVVPAPIFHPPTVVGSSMVPIELQSSKTISTDAYSVLCKHCKNPQTDVIIKDGHITLDCKACGCRTDISLRLKLRSFILKNQPKKGKIDKATRKLAAPSHKRMVTDFNIAGICAHKLMTRPFALGDRMKR